MVGGVLFTLTGARVGVGEALIASEGSNVGTASIMDWAAVPPMLAGGGKSTTG